jgi:hypothetical protein
MTPDARAVLADLAGRFAQVVAPNVKPAYLAGSVGLSAMLLAALAEEWDRAAQRLVEENRAIRTIFRKAAPLSPGSLAERLGMLAAGADDDLHVSALEAANDALRAALTDLHAWIETQTGDAAQAVNEDIWAELAQSTQRRRFSTQPF